MRKDHPVFIYSQDYHRSMFNADGSDNTSVDNTQFFPSYLPRHTDFYFLNFNSGDVVSDPQGNHPVGWNPNTRNKQQIDDAINSFPRRMLENLVLISGKDGSPIPIAGSYFTKMLDHEPGTIQPYSCLITDENGEIPGLTNFAPTDIDGGTFGGES